MGIVLGLGKFRVSRRNSNYSLLILFCASAVCFSLGLMCLSNILLGIAGASDSI